MKADLPRREPEILARWDKLRLYEELQRRNADRPPFILHDGPPYANGPIHVGHALNKILKDFIVKQRSMAGFRSPYVPGWDCHGLPIEHQLMKEKGWDKRTVDRALFRQEAARYAERWIDAQRRDFKRLGVIGDWENPYKTLDPEYEAGIVRTFYDLLKKGRVHRDKKPVYWCASCETALAEAEVEYADKTSTSVYVKFPVLEWPQNAEVAELAKAAGRNASVLVWTTTPWTLPANAALAFHPEQKYRLWESPRTHEKYLVGEPGWRFLEKEEGPAPAAAAGAEGMALEGLLCRNPLNNNHSQGILADFVSAEDGTGVVHIAPGHGQEDFTAGKEYGLPVLSPVDDAGRFTADVMPNELAGVQIWKANARIVELLEKSHGLYKQAPVAHSYPHCWRCKHPVIFRAAEQWFLRVDDGFRRDLLASVDGVEWTPAYGKERILGMLKTRPDWCLSRQRLWGCPIPMFACKACKEPLMDERVFDRVVGLVRKFGGGRWFEEEAAALVEGAACGKCGKKDFRKEEDILDVWFDSGASWAAVLRARAETRGVDRRDVMYLEGSDQHRGWFQTSLLPALALTGEPPYKRVLTHGFVLDGQGRAMSKSEGNVIAPQEIIEKFGADVLRLWVAMTDYREDVRLSKDILDRVVDTYRKIRNTLRFLLGNLSGFDPSRAAPRGSPELDPFDAEMLSYMDQVVREVGGYYDRFEFHLVSAKICNELCIGVLSEHYLDVLKDVLYCDRPDSPRRRSAQTVLLALAKDLARLLAPLLSFTAEETWQCLREQGLLDAADAAESVFLNPFPKPRGSAPGPDRPMQALTALKREINLAVEKARQSGLLKGAGDAHVTVAPDPKAFSFDVRDAARLAACLGAAKLTVAPFNPDDKSWVRGVEKAPGEKCPRCWISRELTPEGLCARCADAEAAAPGPVA